MTSKPIIAERTPDSSANTMILLGPTPWSIIEHAKTLGVLGWPQRAERRPSGTWVHNYLLPPQGQLIDRLMQL